jgi:hypothetical protein
MVTILSTRNQQECGMHDDAVASSLGRKGKVVSRKGAKLEHPSGEGRGSLRLPTPKERIPPEERRRAARLRRYQLQNHSARLLPLEGVAHCYRVPTSITDAVTIQYVPSQHSAHFSGLQICKSVWHCPICAAKISERRREEVARLVKKHIEAGGAVYMSTYTIRHDRYDDLSDLVARFLAARRKMRQGRRGMALRKDFAVLGTVSVLEVTWSAENGWHPHQHELVFVEGELDTDRYETAARAAWTDAAEAYSLTMNEHGFDLKRTYGAVADYIAKYGHEPAVEHPWGVESELTKGHIKQGRQDVHYTPFALLSAIADGVTRFEPLFQEYARVFKGRKQLNCSPGLKSRYAEEEKSDEELAEESQDHDAFPVVEIEKEPWTQVVATNVRGHLLEQARAGRVGDCLAGLSELGIDARPSDLTHWRVSTPKGMGEVLSLNRCDLLHRWRCSVLIHDEQGQHWRAFDLTQVTFIDPPPALISSEHAEDRKDGEL